jgi:hypothetical protein
LRARIGFFGHADPGAEGAVKRRIEISFKPSRLDLAQNGRIIQAERAGCHALPRLRFVMARKIKISTYVYQEIRETRKGASVRLT